MSRNLHPIRTKETLIIGFESPPAPVAGELNLREVLRTWEHYHKCTQTTETNYDSQNFLYIVIPQQLWPYFSTKVRPADPQDPGENPSYDQGKTQMHNTTVRDFWQFEKGYWNISLLYKQVDAVQIVFLFLGLCGPCAPRFAMVVAALQPRFYVPCAPPPLKICTFCGFSSCFLV